MRSNSTPNSSPTRRCAGPHPRALGLALALGLGLGLALALTLTLTLTLDSAQALAPGYVPPKAYEAGGNIFDFGAILQPKAYDMTKPPPPPFTAEVRTLTLALAHTLALARTLALAHTLYWP